MSKSIRDATDAIEEFIWRKIVKIDFYWENEITEEKLEELCFLYMGCRFKELNRILRQTKIKMPIILKYEDSPHSFSFVGNKRRIIFDINEEIENYIIGTINIISRKKVERYEISRTSKGLKNFFELK